MSIFMLCKVKIHWNNNITPVQKWLHRRIFFWLYINYCGTFYVILTKNNILVHANTFGQGACSWFAMEQTWRQKANDRRPPSMDFDFLLAKKLISSQEPRWMQRTMYIHPKERPAKIPCVWQKSLSNRQPTRMQRTKVRKTNRICQISWDDFIFQGNDIRIAILAYLYVK